MQTIITGSSAIFPSSTAKALVQLVKIAVFPSYLSSSKDTFKQFYLLAIETQD